MSDLDAIADARQVIGEVFHERGISVAIGASALASMLLDVLVLQKEHRDPNASAAMKRLAERLEQLAAASPADVRALAEQLADVKPEDS